MSVKPHAKNLNSDGLPDGDYVVHIASGVVSWGSMPVTGVQTLTVVAPLRLDAPADAHNPIVSMMGFLVADDGTDFSLVFDDTGEPIYVEDS